MKKPLLTILSCSILLSIVSCKKADTDKSAAEKTVAYHPGFGNGNLPLIGYERTPDILLTNASGYHVYNGGYGRGLGFLLNLDFQNSLSIKIEVGYPILRFTYNIDPSVRLVGINIAAIVLVFFLITIKRKLSHEAKSTELRV